MKHFFPKAFLLFLLIFSWACEGPSGPEGPIGPVGPQGPEGPQGLDGESAPEAVVIEYEGIDFVGPDYHFLLEFPDYQPLKSDAVLVYALWETIPLENGEFKDVWRLLPQTIFYPEGTLVFNYDHSYEDVDLILEANFDISSANLGPVALEDWVIRLVFVPGQYLSNARSNSVVDFSNYEEVKKHFDLEHKPVKRQTIKRPAVE